MTMTRQEQNENDHFFSFFELSEDFPSLALFFFFPVDEPEPELLPTDFDFTFLVTCLPFPTDSSPIISLAALYTLSKKTILAKHKLLEVFEYF